MSKRLPKRLPKQLPKYLRWSLLLILSLAVCVSFTIWRHSTVHVALEPPLPQDPLIQAYFNHSQSASYREPYQSRERLGDDLEGVLLEAIAQAQRSVDVAVQELRLPRLAQALRDRHRAGVQVRVILENQYNHLWNPAAVANLDERDRADYEEFLRFADEDGDGQATAAEQAERDAIAILQAAGIPVLDDTADGSKGSDLMHHKFLVIDQQRVVMGSANFTLSGVHGDYGSATSLGNANHLLLISSPALAQVFTAEFNLMWGDGPEGLPNSLFGLQKPYRSAQRIELGPYSAITVQFSPSSPSRKTWSESVNGLIGRALTTATQTIDLALFVFSDQYLSDILQQEQQSGTQIRALIEPGFAYRSYSEALDLMGVSLPDQRCRYEADNRPWSRPLMTVGVPQLGEGDVLHHKFAVIDGRTVITGSQNWSAAANHSNDENLVVIENATVAAHFQREFDRLYSTASLGVPSWLQDKISQQRSRCAL